MLLDLEFIIKIAKEKIEKLKTIPKNPLNDPSLTWFQNDPQHKKANELMSRYKVIASQISSQTTLEQQKIIIRKNKTQPTEHPCILFVNGVQEIQKRNWNTDNHQC